MRVVTSSVRFGSVRFIAFSRCRCRCRCRCMHLAVTGMTFLHGKNNLQKNICGGVPTTNYCQFNFGFTHG